MIQHHSYLIWIYHFPPYYPGKKSDYYNKIIPTKCYYRNHIAYHKKNHRYKPYYKYETVIKQNLSLMDQHNLFIIENKRTT